MLNNKVGKLEATVAQQQKQIETLTAQLKEQAAQIQKVSAQLRQDQEGRIQRGLDVGPRWPTGARSGLPMHIVMEAFCCACR
jgi:hypothetical protein